MTSVSLDHTKILGKTVEAIASDKAGIIKHKRPIVIGPSVPLNIVANVAKNKESPLYRVFGSIDNTINDKNDSNGDIVDDNEYYTYIDPKWDNLNEIFQNMDKEKEARLNGSQFKDYNQENDAIACCSLEIINSELNRLGNVQAQAQAQQQQQQQGQGQAQGRIQQIQQIQYIAKKNVNIKDFVAYLNIKPKCRLEMYKLYLSLTSRLSSKSDLIISPVDVVLDVAHNPGGMRSLFESLNNIYPRKNYCYRVVIGMCQDKDIRKCMIEVVKYASHIHLVCAKNFYRSSPIDNLEKKIIQCMNDLGIENKNKNKSQSYVSTYAKGNVGKEIKYALKESAIHNANYYGNVTNVESDKINVRLLSSTTKDNENNSGSGGSESINIDLNNDENENENENDDDNDNESVSDDDSERKSDFAASDFGYDDGDDDNGDRIGADRIAFNNNNGQRSVGNGCLKDQKEVLIIMGTFHIMTDARRVLGMNEEADDVHLDQKVVDDFNKLQDNKSNTNIK